MPKKAVKNIEIKCKGNIDIPLKELESFQGTLKTLSDVNYNKLKSSILQYGFRIPVFVWNKKILDGHQRLFVVQTLVDKEGYTIGDIPAIELQADDEKSAKKLVLMINSNYGKISYEGLYEFMNTAEIETEFLKQVIDLPEINMDLYQAGYVGDEELPDVEMQGTQKNIGYINLIFDKSKDFREFIDALGLKMTTRNVRWNDLKSLKGPYRYFGGILIPDKLDKNGDIIYIYNGRFKDARRVSCERKSAKT